jgi:hypothetical protein
VEGERGEEEGRVSGECEDDMERGVVMHMYMYIDIYTHTQTHTDTQGQGPPWKKLRR